MGHAPMTGSRGPLLLALLESASVTESQGHLPSHATSAPALLATQSLT